MWQDLATQGERLLQQGEYLTIWMHHWIGLALARAGRWDKVQQQLASAAKPGQQVHAMRGDVSDPERCAAIAKQAREVLPEVTITR